jgi:transcriptional regulator of acetoin/glycerol metabolism
MQPSEPLMESLMAYDWPGNVRELKHCMDRMSAMHSEGAALQMQDLPSPLQDARAAAGLGRHSTMVNEGQGWNCRRWRWRDLAGDLDFAKRAEHDRKGAVIDGRRARAGREDSGIGRTTLYRKMKQYGIE